MERLDIEKDIKWVVATMDEVPLFVTRDVLLGKYYLTADIKRASKGVDKETAFLVRDYYYKENDPDRIRDFTILPIEVTYKLLVDE